MRRDGKLGSCPQPVFTEEGDCMTVRIVPVAEVLTWLSADGHSGCWLSGQTVADILFATRRKGPAGESDMPFWGTLRDIEQNGMKFPVHGGLVRDIAADYGLDP
jgi:hypothetical protein